jgi:asparagine synthetase B (glutamine-hydrolysing)
MFILCRYIRQHTPFRVVFSGECADELFQGYLFNYEIPTDD